MSLLSKLFGGGSKPEPEPEIHEDFRIYPEPARQGSGYRIGARIEKEIDGETRSHMMIRADTFDNLDGAIEGSISKAKMVIDDLGDRMFT